MPLAFADAVVAPAAWRPHLLDFRCTLVDLGRIPDPELAHQAMLRIGLLILKRGTTDGDLRRTLADLGRAALALGLDELVVLILVERGGPRRGPRCPGGTHAGQGSAHRVDRP